MTDEYYQSEESYKGFILKIRRFRYSDTRLVYHRACDIFKDNERIGISKTKREAKDLISHGCFR